MVLDVLCAPCCLLPVRTGVRRGARLLGSSFFFPLFFFIFYFFLLFFFTAASARCIVSSWLPSLLSLSLLYPLHDLLSLFARFSLPHTLSYALSVPASVPPLFLYFGILASSVVH